MRRLFRSFERSGVDSLLVSGQACVLYGAATFSEDIDLWIRPTSENAGRFLRALARCRARVDRLTPPLSPRLLRRGHGFHFLIPAEPSPVYLDVMGKPPRVPSFETARRRAQILTTDWGRVPVISIEDLVSMKKTRRLADYEVITNLVRIRVSLEGAAAPALLRWAAENSFRPEQRAEFLRRLGERVNPEGLRRRIAREVSAHQARDLLYWKPVVEDLRRRRRAGTLLPEGLPVARLLRSR